MWYASNDSNVLSFFLPSFLLPRPSRKLSPHMTSSMSSLDAPRHPQEFYELLFLDTVLYSRHARTKEFLSQQLLSKNGHHKCKCARSAIRHKRLAVLPFERYLDLASRLVRTRILRSRKLIPEDVKFFNSTVNASTAIVRGYAYIYLLTSGSARFPD